MQRPGPSPGVKRPRADRRSSLAHAILWFVLSYGISILGYLVVNAVAARLLGAADFGYFMTIYTITLVLGQGALIGVHRAGLREAARIIRSDDPMLGELRADVVTVIRLLLPAVGLLSAACAWFLLDGPVGERFALAAGIGALVVLAGHQKLWANYLRGFSHIRLAGLLEGRSGGPLVAAGQALLLLAVAAIDPGATWALSLALAALAFGYVAPVAIGALVMRPHLAAVARPDRTITAQSLRIARRDWRFFLLTTGTAISQNVELWVAAILLTSAESSLFAGGQRLALLLVFPLMSLQVVFSPAIARLWSQGNRVQLERLLRTGATCAFAVSAALLAPMLVAPRWVMSTVYGEDFAAGALVLVLVCAGSMCQVLSGLCGAVLSMSGHEGVPALTTVVSLGGRILVGGALAASFGIEGLAAGSAAMSLLLNAALWWYAWRRLRVNTFPTVRPRLELLREIPG